MREPGDRHDDHDLELVARAAAGDLGVAEATAARDRLAACGACAALAVDLRAIAAATRELGAAGSHVAIGAARDFRISPSDAERLRRRGFLHRLRPMVPAGGRARGLGGGLATLGLVGLLVATGLPGSAGGAASPSSGSELGAAEQTDSAALIPAVAPAASGARALVTSSDSPGSEDRSADGTVATLTPAMLLGVASVAALILGLAVVLGAGPRRRAGP
ncbi:MAG: hypothetical protein EPO36_01785 [Chloroflexota bacterium]|nr:MAG: hypothetical protein EPO36_01785 [Chloroflexota bacterium]